MIPMMQLGQLGRSNPSSAAPELVDLFAALGVTKLVSAYGGNAMRVRRSSDNTEQDIGFSGTALDTAALASFVGANNAFVVTWYDQTGAGNNFTQATSTAQPRIVNAGTYDGKLVFTAGDDNLLCVNNCAATSAKMFFAKMKMRNYSGPVPFEYGDASNLNPSHGMQHYTVGSTNLEVYIGDSSGLTYRRWGMGFDTDSVCGSLIDRAASPTATGLTIHKDGVLQSPSLSSSGGTASTHNALKWRLGCRSGADGANLDLFNFFAYESNKTADAGTISTLLA